MTKYSQELVEKTFSLYSSGMPVEQVSKKSGISKITIYNWANKYDWIKRSKKIQEKAIEQVDETLTEIKKRQHLLLKAIMARFSKQLKIDEVKVTPSDLIAALKHELLLFSELEISVRENVVTARDVADIYEELYGNPKDGDLEVKQNGY